MAAYHHVRSYRDIPGSLLIQHGSYQWSPWTISRASMPERSRFIGASDGPLGSATCDSSPKTLARERGNIANVPARPGRHVVGLDPVFPQAPRDRRRARRELAGRRDCHAGTGLGTQSPGFARDLARRPSVVFARTGHKSSEVRSPHVVVKTPLKTSGSQRSSRVSRKQR